MAKEAANLQNKDTDPPRVYDNKSMQLHIRAGTILYFAISIYCTQSIAIY